MSRGFGATQRWALEYLRWRWSDDDGLDREETWFFNEVVEGAPGEHSKANRGIWHVSMESMALAKYGEHPTRSEVEALRRALRTLEAADLVTLDILGGRIVVVFVDVELPLSAADRDAGVSAAIRHRRHPSQGSRTVDRPFNSAARIGPEVEMDGYLDRQLEAKDAKGANNR